MTDLYYLSQADGAGEWREKEAKDLSELVQNRITYLQVGKRLPPLLIVLGFRFTKARCGPSHGGCYRAPVP